MDNTQCHIGLAKLALQVLDAQQLYFKARGHRNLIASKNLEAQLRSTATQVTQMEGSSVVIPRDQLAALTRASRMVLDRWASGDLAEAVRAVEAALNDLERP